MLGYLSHVDTVLADAGGLAARPVVRRACTTASLWGRGAIDMKSQTAAEAVAAARLARERLAPAARRAEGHLASSTRRPAATLGAQVAHRAAARTSRASTTCSTRAPARSCPYGDRRLYGVCVRREGHVPLQRRARAARAGHASVPGAGRQRAAQARARARAARRAAAPRYDVDRGAARAPARRSARTRTTRRARSSACARSSRGSPRCVEPTLGVTFAPTIVSRRREDQRDPGARASSRVDCRVPPGHGRRRRAGAASREVLGDATTGSSSSSPRRSSATARRSTRR